MATLLATGLTRVGRATLLAWHILKVLPRPRLYFNSALQQAYIMGIASLPLVLLIAFLGGAVTSQQTGSQFSGGLPLWVVGSVLTINGPSYRMRRHHERVEQLRAGLQAAPTGE